MKVPKDAVTAEEWRALEEGAVFHVRRAEARYGISGTGALACLQGLVTSDINAAPDHSRLFGALLTSKGMIVAPLWLERRSAQQFTVETPAAAAPALEEVLARSLPPRLCRWENLSDATMGLGLYGPRAGTDILPFPSGLPAVARGARGFDGELAIDAAVLILDELEQQLGVTRASDALMESCRILSGIPSLGAEIDTRTLPQEVRMEELGAISYTKGCYLGQETVARLHFRGHANRRLALLVLDAEPAVPAEVRAGDKAVGQLTSACWSPELDAWVGQAVLRREVEDGADVDAGGTGAVVRVGRWLREP